MTAVAVCPQPQEPPPVTPPRATAGEVVLVLSIDTEEDNWIPTRQWITTDNIRALASEHQRLVTLGVRPTYFATHAVASDPWAAELLRAIDRGGEAEVAAHLHPWNTPPLREALVPRNTMLANLPAELQRRKLEQLTDRLEEVLGHAPRAFRAGRFGIGRETAAALVTCGYVVDSSVTPYTSWRQTDDGPSHEGAPACVYRIAPGHEAREPQPGGPLVEVPPSFGYSRAPFHRWGPVHRAVTSVAGRALLLDHAAARLGLVKKVTLSPETDTVDDMLALSRALLAEGTQYLHLYWHSPSLRPGLTPFVRSTADLRRFHDRVEAYVTRLAGLVTLRFATVSEAAGLLQPALAPAERPA